MLTLVSRNFTDILVSKMFNKPSQKIIDNINQEFINILQKFSNFLNNCTDEEDDDDDDDAGIDFSEIEDNVTNIYWLYLEDVKKDNDDFKSQTPQNPIKRRYKKNFTVFSIENDYNRMKYTILDIIRTHGD